ncbi:hypothetical protein BGW80DRAFT_1529938 [Lactifluus volemus]|nr:hypothetical protein BGW80DRAFT_1529938 [Lactifluus volemus]
MLRSTLTTGSYTLKKYSRSYPPNVPLQTPSQDPTARQPEWQHYVNPVITLTLDVKKSMDGNFESVRLRINWNIDAGGDGMQREITMEDLDLLSFSSLDAQIHPGQGSPLKAVYCGVAVGIRYQYPLFKPATSPTSYRRFQVNFSSSSDAAQFIDAIRPVCPCKENPDPPHRRSPQTDFRRPPSKLHLQVPHSFEKYSQEEHSQRPPPPLQLSSSDLSLAPPPSSDLAAAPAYSTTTAPLEMHSSQFTVQSTRGGRRNSTSGFSLPASSQPASSAATLAPPTQGSTVGTQLPPPPAGDKTREAFLESLREVPELYSLTRPELENLVSVVVREPGFTRLLEALDSMWVIRGFLGQ